MHDGTLRRTSRQLTPAQKAGKLAWFRAKYANDPEFRERIKARSREQYRANPVPYKLKAARRRALRVTPEAALEMRWKYEVREQLALLMGRPVVCDHAVSLKAGGGHVPQNIVHGTAKWNGRKAGRSLHELRPDELTHLTFLVDGPDGRPRLVPVYHLPQEIT